MSGAPSRPPRRVDVATSLTQTKQFEQCYKDAYQRIDKAITLVTENKHQQATHFFQCGLSLLQRALDLDLTTLDIDEDTLRHYREMQEKMKITRAEVEQHFFDSQVFSGATTDAGYPAVTVPPSYNETSAQDNGVAYPQLPAQELTPTVTLPTRPQPPGGLLAPLAAPTPTVTPVMSPQEGQLLFRLESGVQIFFIFPDGRVTSPSSPSFLEVITFDTPLPVPESGGGGVTGGFLQVGEWSYPLLKATSPVLHSFYGAYMFPDPSNSVPGSHVGIIIPDSVGKEERELFESILTGMTSYQEQLDKAGEAGAVLRQERRGSDGSARSVQSTTSERIAAGLVTGAEVLSSGVVWGAGKMSQLMTHISDRMQETSVPVGDDPNVPETKIDPKLQTTAKAARIVSGKAVKVSSYILGQVGKATLTLGRKAAPHLQYHGTRAISSITGQTVSQSSGQVDGVMDVAAGAVQGACTVYMGLEKAAETLASSLTHNTVRVVTHKYGSEAGQLTDNTMHAVSQSAMAGHNISALGVKGVAKRAAKDTGKALVLNHKEKKQALVPDGAGSDVVEGMELGEEVRESTDAGHVEIEQAQEVTQQVVQKYKPAL